MKTSTRVLFLVAWAMLFSSVMFFIACFLFSDMKETLANISIWLWLAAGVIVAIGHTKALNDQERK